MAQPFETTFILFVDMLGFAALVEKEGEELNELNPIFTGVELYSPSPAESLLGYRFINFHRCLNQARVRMQEMGAGTAIVFSDSAFFRMDTLDTAINIARTMMFELVTSEIPVRMGLARGSYRMLRFLTDSSAHVSFHMSQFLGTGIVRAYQTEGCGVPGLRILLHPDLEPLLDKKAHANRTGEAQREDVAECPIRSQLPRRNRRSIGPRFRRLHSVRLLAMDDGRHG